MKKITLSLSLFIFCFYLSNAQNVSGILLEKETQSPIPFATIQLGDNYGVVTNKEGDFSINTQGFSPTDSLVFSSMGYTQKTIALSDFKKDTVYLVKNTQQLRKIFLTNKKLTPLEIMQKVNKNLKENHQSALTQFSVFHRLKSSVTPKAIDFRIKKAEFIKRKKIRQFNHLIDSLSEANIGLTTQNYHACLAEFASGKKDTLKGRVKKATKLINEKMSNSMEDISSSIVKQIADIIKSSNTFRGRTGIIPIGDSIDLAKILVETDSTSIDSVLTKNSVMYTKSLLKSSRFAASGYTSIGMSSSGSNRFASDFITDTDAYQYRIKDITSFNGEIVYVINFVPDTGLFSGGGRYTGTLFVSADTFALLKVKYHFAPDEHGMKFNLKFLLGIKFVEQAQAGTLIFSKADDGSYFPKYMQVSGKMYAYFNRGFVFKENEEERKERMKLKLDLEVEMITRYRNEWLFTDSKKITPEAFAQFKNNKGKPIQQLSSYDPEVWTDYNILAPTEAIREYKY